MKQELIPCPFCGATNTDVGFIVHTDDCYLMLRYMGAKKAALINAWNKRLREERLQAEIHRLQDAIKSLRRKEHYACEDEWFSCPKHPEYIGEEDRTVCTCGKDRIDQVIDTALENTESV